MGKFKNAMRTLGEVADALVDNEKKVDELTDKLMQKTYGLDRADVKKIARVLVSQAEVTWK